MDQNKQATTNPEQGPSFSVITIPEELREQVQDFVAQLTQEDEDVSGYMLRGVSSSSIRTTLMNSFSATGCSTTNTGGLQDINCLDND